MPSKQTPDRGKPAPAPAAPEPADESSASLPFSVVGIGGSAGGLEAFTQLLKALPPDTGMAFVFVLHMGNRQKSVLSEIASRATRMPVSEVDQRAKVEPNHVYVISPGTNLVLEDGALVPSGRSEEHGSLKNIDNLFMSLATELGHQAIGVVLSGSASDGALGLEQIKGEGGITFAQDGTAQHDSMPHSAIAMNCVDFVLAPDEIAREIVRIARHPLLAGGVEVAEVLPPVDTAVVLEALQNATGVDFSHYKRNTLLRRISRRMLLNQIERSEKYVEFLQSTPGEIEALYQDVLIGVTSFFRDREIFDILKADVFPRLVANRSRNDVVRIWALGCSTGEEAYSLAIAFSEFVETTGRTYPLQVFATDLNGKGIDKARAGHYSGNIVDDVGPERLRRYFVEEGAGYRVRKSIRDLCVFARHNVLSEPPFSRIDLISCRNLLIYLGAEMQQRIIPTLHYALRPNGYLVLGKSETIGTFRDLFDLVDARHKLYFKKPVAPRLLLGGIISGARARAGHGPDRQIPAHENTVSHLIDAQKEAERLLLTRYAPASVLVNDEFDILQFRGNTGAYLTPAPGRASLNLIKMLREGLLVPVRNLLNKARKEGEPERKEGLSVKSNGGYHDVAIEVLPIKGARGVAASYLVLFEEAMSSDRKARLKRQRVEAQEDKAEDRTSSAKQELAATREYLQSIIEQQEAANEELQSANEEIQSANEELQSINEELETSKEEVQSSNEELSTVNEELNHRNAELSHAHNDLLNLLSSVQMAIVMIGANLRIRTLTPGAEKMLNLIPTDVGRPIGDLNLSLSVHDLERHLQEVIDTVAVKEFEVRDKQGKWHLLRLRPYRTMDNVIDGVVVILIDIDSLKRDQEKLRHQAELLDQAYEPILMWEMGGTVTYWSKAAEGVYGYTRAEALRRRMYDLLGTVESAAEIEEKLQKHGRWSGKLVHTKRDGGKINVSSRMSLVSESDGRKLVIETIHPLEDHA
jgi:two-component system, chemotaxis family, CheB/CheR fusion protein